MARPREFDEGFVLEAAMGRFWEKGYEATSVRELAESMRMTGASLYNAFGDKRSLFKQVLQRYIDRNTAGRISRVEGRFQPRDAIEEFLGDIVERSLDDPERKGCLLVNSALDIAPHDPEFASTVADGLRLLESFFRRAAAAGQAQGTVSSERSADDLGRILLSTLVGIRVLARSRPERDLLEGLLRPAVTLLDGQDIRGHGGRRAQ